MVEMIVSAKVVYLIGKQGTGQITETYKRKSVQIHFYPDRTKYSSNGIFDQTKSRGRKNLATDSKK